MQVRPERNIRYSLAKPRKTSHGVAGLSRSDPHFPDAASARAALDQASKQPRPSVKK